LLLVNGWLYVSDSYLRAWAAQNQILSPNVFHYILAYGWVLPFVYLGIRAMLARQPAKAEFLLVWSVLLPILIYAPIGLQRRLAEGAWVMLIVLSLYAFDQGLMAMRRRELLVFSLAFPGTLVLLLGALQLASTASTPIFRATDEVTAFEELRGLAPPGEVVLASYETGNALPAWAPLRVVVGHGPESVGLDKLWPRLQAFYQGRTSDDVRLELLQQYAKLTDMTYCRHACNDCEGACPYGVQIADTLRTRMYALDYGDSEFARREYGMLTINASACLSCDGKPCQNACTHGIDIARLCGPTHVMLS
ncbi:MAG: hypothetical protein WD558_02340, partial [Pseudomonadales bacterium]